MNICIAEFRAAN
jgi:hypothetical protein